MSFHFFKFSWPLNLDNEIQKEFMVCVGQRDNSGKDTKDVLTDLPYGAIRRLNPLQGGSRVTTGMNH